MFLCDVHLILSSLCSGPSVTSLSLVLIFFSKILRRLHHHKNRMRNLKSMIILLPEQFNDIEESLQLAKENFNDQQDYYAQRKEKFNELRKVSKKCLKKEGLIIFNN
uniref:Uncharacterized protein n=1 Tax=Heterorhabditis bacteriophora TaxID=37862 RepID=A0A1I7WTP1_HETBA